MARLHLASLVWLSLGVSCATAPPAEPPEPCPDSLRELNAAVRGPGLSDAQRGCLEVRLNDPVERKTASDLLIWDARSDEARWKQRIERHLAEIEPDRLDYILDLARHAQREGPGGADRSARWIDLGLAVVSTAPPGKSSEEAHYELLKLQAIAAEMRSPPEGSPETRRRTADAARAWYLLGKDQGKATEWPLAMCANAGAPEDYCRGRTDAY